MSLLEEYYNTRDEEKRLLSQHGQVEYLTTMKYIHECISHLAVPCILEVGAGTGRYSIALAKEGYSVTAVELVPHNLDVLKSKLDGSEPITAIQGNALDLSVFRDQSLVRHQCPTSDLVLNHLQPAGVFFFRRQAQLLT